MPMNGNEYVSLGVAADATDIPPRTLRYWIECGRLPAEAGDHGRRVRISDVWRVVGPPDTAPDVVHATLRRDEQRTAAAPGPDVPSPDDNGPAGSADGADHPYLSPTPASAVVGQITELLARVQAAEERADALERELQALRAGAGRAAALSRGPALGLRARLLAWLRS